MHTVDTLDLLVDTIETKPSGRSTSTSNQDDSHKRNTGFYKIRRSERGRFRSQVYGEQDDHPGRQGLCTYSRQERCCFFENPSVPGLSDLSSAALAPMLESFRKPEI